MHALHEALAREHQREMQQYVRHGERLGRAGAERRYQRPVLRRRRHHSAR